MYTSPRDIPASINQATGWLAAGQEHKEGVGKEAAGVDGVRPRTGARVRDDFKKEPTSTVSSTVRYFIYYVNMFFSLCHIIFIFK